MTRETTKYIPQSIFIRGMAESTYQPIWSKRNPQGSCRDRD